MILALLACADEPLAAACDAPDAELSPLDGSLDVPPDTVVTVRYLEPPAEDPRLWLDGGVTGGVSADAGRRIWTFTPDAPLPRDTTYTLLADVCGAEARTAFTTLGEPVGDTVAGRTYRLEMDEDDVSWEAPPGASVIADFLGSAESLLFQLTPDGEGGLDLLVVPGEEVDADFGPMADTPPVALSAPFELDPWFETTPAPFELVTPTGPFTVYDFVASGAITADAGAIERLAVAGLVDLGPIMVDFPNACDLAAAAGGECVPCPGQDTGDACLFVQLEDASSPFVEGLSL